MRVIRSGAGAWIMQLHSERESERTVGDLCNLILHFHVFTFYNIFLGQMTFGSLHVRCSRFLQPGVRRLGLRLMSTPRERSAARLHYPLAVSTNASLRKSAGMRAAHILTVGQFLAAGVLSPDVLRLVCAVVTRKGVVLASPITAW